jgi:hypothetical protein
MSYYTTDSADPDAPVLLEEYNGIKPEDEVTDHGPVAPLQGRLTVKAIYQFTYDGQGGWVTAILKGDDGSTYEVNADHLRIRRGCPDGGTCHHECGRGGCFRIDWAGPLSGVYPGDVWPEEVREAEHARGSGGHL